MKRCAGVALLIWLIAPGLAAAPPVVSDLADQAVLVHRITKSACLMVSGADTPVHGEDVAASTAALSALTQGSTGIIDGPVPLRRNVDVLNRSALQIAAGDRHSVPFALMLRMNMQLSQHYSDLRARSIAAEPAPHAAAHALVHELRVASQAFQRDLCLYLTDLATPMVAHDMDARLAFFGHSVSALLAGDPDQSVPPPPTIHIKIALGKVESKWRTLEPILAQASSGHAIEPRDAQLASVLGDAILRNLDEIADRFQNL
ncbi:MAG: hypothetical protein AB3N09_06420 [Tateyamaria sp.]